MCFFYKKSHHRMIINNYKWGNVNKITEKLTYEAQRFELFRGGVMENVGPTRSCKESLLSTFLLHFCYILYSTVIFGKSSPYYF